MDVQEEVEMEGEGEIKVEKESLSMGPTEVKPEDSGEDKTPGADVTEA
jgi:hypothetical protein